MFGLKDSKTKVTSLESRSEALFNVLNTHCIFGEIDEAKLEVERHAFKETIIEHAIKGNDYHFLELTYPSGVRLVITTTVFAGLAMFANVAAYAHPKNERINYDTLNREIMDVLNDLSVW